jgi:hypothetical protein
MDLCSFWWAAPLIYHLSSLQVSTEYCQPTLDPLVQTPRQYLESYCPAIQISGRDSTHSIRYNKLKTWQVFILFILMTQYHERSIKPFTAA